MCDESYGVNSGVSTYFHTIEFTLLIDLIVNEVMQNGGGVGSLCS